MFIVGNKNIYSTRIITAHRPCFYIPRGPSLLIARMENILVKWTEMPPAIRVQFSADQAQTVFINYESHNSELILKKIII